MTDAQLLSAIKANPAWKTLADAGSDSTLSDAMNAAQPVAVPITVAGLMGAAPTTLASLSTAADPISQLEVIAGRVRAGDSAGVGSWADILLLKGIMSQSEHTAVQSLVAAATGSTALVGHSQVSAALNSIRPVVDGAPRATPIDWSQVS